MKPSRFTRFLPAAMRENRPARTALAFVAGGLLGLVLLGAVIHTAVSGILEHRRGTFSDMRSAVSARTVALLRDLEQTKEQRTRFREVRLAPVDVAHFLRRLEQLAAAAGVVQQIETLSPETVAEPRTYASPVIRFRLTLEGTLGAVIAYLRVLDTVPEFVLVEDIHVTSPQEEDLRTAAVASIQIAVASRDE